MFCKEHSITVERSQGRNPNYFLTCRMRINKILFAICTTFVLIAAAHAQTTITDTSLKAAADVRRDGRSIPYVSAMNDPDLYFAQGYVTASDRLWQMDLLRRVSRGETAEIFGKTTLEEDKRWRKFGFAKVAEDSLAHLSPDLRAALEAYARGVNAYIGTLDDKTLPV